MEKTKSCLITKMERTKSCLITQNLISAIDWYDTAPHSIVKPEHGGNGEMTWKDKAYNDLVMTVNRQYGDMSPAAQHGIDFEKEVYRSANKDAQGGSPLFREVCNEVRGFQFFQKGGKYVDVNGHTCYVFAKYDAISLPIIKDIKTTQSYKANKYLGTFQHQIYCYVSGADRFEYIVAEWEEYPKIKAIHKELYVVNDRSALEEEVHMKISETLIRLEDLDLWDAYREKFCLY